MYKNLIEKTINESIALKKKVIEENIDSINNIGEILIETIRNGHKLLFCGNGGSAADAQHIVAELVIRFRSSVNRPAIPAITLTVDPSIMTAGGNDIGFDNIFAREVEALGQKGDVIIGISTSGNSENILRAFIQAKKQGLITIGLLGAGGGKIINESDYSVVIPGDITARIQESHIMVGHIWCEILEEGLFKEYIK